MNSRIGTGAGRELGDRQLDGQQQRQNEDADPDQPYQPIPLVKRRLHCDPMISKIVQSVQFANRSSCQARGVPSREALCNLVPL